MIGVLSDAHGNIHAFRLAIDYLKNLGVRKFYFLGDAVGYIPGLAVVDELQTMGDSVKCILGNHEFMMLSGSTEPEDEAVYQHGIGRRLITQKQISFLNSWPTHRRESLNGNGVLFVHGSPLDFTNGYVYPDSDLSRFNVSERFAFMGHSHHPFIKCVNGTIFVNVGSCGLPRDDGRYGSFATFAPEQNIAELYRFDISQSVELLSNSRQSPPHPSVMELFKRTSCSLSGTLFPPPRTNL